MTEVERVLPDQVISAEQRAEAQAASDQAKAGAENLWEGLARMVAVNGWFALGYRSFRQWAHEELGQTFGVADQQLRKTRVLLALAEETGLPIAELETRVPLRAKPRAAGKPKVTPAASTMRSAVRRLALLPVLTSPEEISTAKDLRAHLDRLLGQR